MLDHDFKRGVDQRDLYIELDDYTYFHSPTNQQQQDNRFIGRQELRSKIRSLIVDSETKSGAYLVTGFRGMGKTSLINQVINDILQRKNTLPHRHRFVRLFIAFFLLSFLNLQKVIEDISELSTSNTILGLLIVSIPGIICFRSWKYLQRRDSESLHPNLSVCRSGNPEKVKLKRSLLLRVFLLKEEKETPSNQLDFLAQDFILLNIGNYGILLIWLIQEIFGKNLLKIEYYEKFWLHVLAFLTVTLLPTLIGLILPTKPIRLVLNDGALKKLFIRSGRRINKRIVSFFNYEHIIKININLGQDNIDDKQILKLIAQSISTEYKKLKSPFYSLRRLTWRISAFLLIYIIILTTYYYEPTYLIFNDLRSQLNLTEYFPSQSIFGQQRLTYQMDLDIQRTLEDEMEKSQNLKENAFTKKDSAKLEPETASIQRWYDEMISAEKGMNSEYIYFYIIDYYVWTIYTELTHSLFSRGDEKSSKQTNSDNIERTLLNSSLKLDRDVHFLPARLDYLFVLYFGIVWFLIMLIYRSGLFGINHRIILRSLNQLEQHMESEVSMSSQGGISFQFFNLLGGKNRNFPVLEQSGIESKLIKILEKVERIPGISVRPKFVFVFDELDKIEADNEETKDKNEKTERESQVSYFAHESSQKRQELIIKVLSNLKYFFNTAKAKFFFISGREMFDASLADISDRESSNSSLFHGVVYVNSFYKDDSDTRKSDITSMTENYVCQFLPCLPDEPIDEQYKLGSYNRYLKAIEIPIGERAKTIVALQNFINYLTYRASGSPKKITNIFEKYVLKIESEEIQKIQDRQSILIGRNVHCFYLRLRDQEQYIFSFSTYLFNPFLLAVSRHLTNFGDKLLVSTSFLLDHLYKYHRTGFDFKNLELTPEILAVNKAPELRSFIERLLTFLSRSHIRIILNGLFDYKFNSRIEKEIEYISKISEPESSAFNFTLDESKEIKRLYKRILNDYQSKPNIARNAGRVSAIDYVSMVLGDLYYADQEYEEALLYYRNASYQLGGDKISEYNLDTLTFYLRNELKSALTYEKSHDLNSALYIYEQLNLKIPKIIKSISTQSKIDTEVNSQIILLTKESIKDSHLPTTTNFASTRLVYQSLLGELHALEKDTLKGITHKELEQNYLLFHRIISETPVEQSYLLAAEYFDKLGDLLFYKNGGLFGDQSNQFMSVEDEENVQLLSNKLKGTNGKPIFDQVYPFSALRQYAASLDILNLLIIQDFRKIGEGNLSKISKNKLNARIKESFPLKSYGGTHFVIKESFAKQIHNLYTYYISPTDPTIRYMKKNEPGKAFPVFRKQVFISLGNSLSDTADCLLLISKLNESTNNNSSESAIKKLSIIEKVIQFDPSQLEDSSEITKPIFLNETELPIFTHAIWLIKLSSWFYMKATDMKEYALQMTKLLYLSRQIASSNTKEKFKQWKAGNEGKDWLKSAKDHIVAKILRMIYGSHEFTESIEIKKYLTIFKGEPLEQIEPFILNHISTSTDTREIVVLYEQLRLDFGHVELHPKRCIIQHFSGVNSKYNRILELHYRAKFNFYLLRDKLASDKLIKKAKENEEFKELIEHVLSSPLFPSLVNAHAPYEAASYLITDTIFCLNECIKNLEVFDLSYLYNHSWRATCYEHLAFWYQLFEAYTDTLHSQQMKDEAQKTLQNRIGFVETEYLSTFNLMERAALHYHAACETHSEGSAYKTITERMFYLDDHFNDNLLHFSCTMERMQFCSGYFKKKIKTIESKVVGESNSLYNVEAYW